MLNPALSPTSPKSDPTLGDQELQNLDMLTKESPEFPTYTQDTSDTASLDQEAYRYSDTDHQQDSNSPEDKAGLYPDGGWRAYSAVLGCFLCCFTVFGMMDSVGAVESYVQSNQLQSTSVSTVSWIFSIYLFISMFLGIFVGPIYDSSGSRWLLSVGTVFTFIGIFTSGSCTQVYQFILSYGVCLGIGTGIMMVPAVSTISSWFSREKRPFLLGMVQSGGSTGGLIFPIMLQFLFPKYGFKWSMRIIAFFNLGVDIVGIILAKDRLKEIREKTGQIDKRTLLDKLKHPVDLKSFKDTPFITLAISLFMNEVAVMIVITYISSYAIAQGASEGESYNMVTILNAMGVLGANIPSYFANFYGPFNMMILMSATLSIVIFVIWLPFGKYTAALYVFVSIFGFCCSSTFALTGATVSAITRKTSDFGKRYGAAYAFVSFESLISLPISGAFIKEKTPKYYDRMIEYPGLFNLSNFIALDSYESQLPIENVSVAGLVDLTRSLDHVSDEKYDSAVELYLSIASYCKRIILDKDLARFDFSLKDVFKIWEIRLNLLLMSVQLTDSKGRIPIPNAKFLRSEVDVLLKELMKLNDKEKTDMESLPDEISFNFGLLIYRVRYGSNVLLLNNYFRQIFNFRLGLANQKTRLLASRRIHRLLFSISALLVVRKQYLELFSQLIDVLACLDRSEIKLTAQVGLLAALVGILMLNEDSDIHNSGYYNDIVQAYDRSLLDHSVFEDLEQVDVISDLEDLVQRVSESQSITPSTVCHLCGRYEMQYMVKDEVAQNNKLDDLLSIVYDLWFKNVHNMYALE
ncbi:hypothetical protein FOA43_001813 [Brettanomyces nanus]|uniref:Major facilitator superfamily (MFS) profile domain-containing protein n=1 Tax=Eeniella nana TaxID=13502 RepID=A0A875S0P8_EENNA|nr:uncharacterized protein FOA43_001813 [Brettanomyces nanus]QPG74483.1 hypothetical protein FOA43_001813 [Brettanomyces nanus]